jgi:hypothetical protein
VAITPKNTRLQAAQRLAGQGYKVFPVPPGKKQSYIAQRSRFGSGEAWGMTNDRVLIEKYWKKWPDANVGLPTGAVNAIIVIETDTAKGHSSLEIDGEMALEALQERLGALPKTWMAESPSGSLHRFYRHPGGKVKNSASELGPGIDVRGDGGMVVVPPSARKDGTYRWLNKLEIAALPAAWVRELSREIERAAPPRELPKDANWAEQYAVENEERPSFEEVQEALNEIPNEGLKWTHWNDVGMRLYAWSPDPDGLELFDHWSALSKEYASKESPKQRRQACQQRWRAYRTSPPTRYTARAIINLAEYGFESGEDEEKKEDEGHDNNTKANGHASAEALGVGDQKRILIPYNFWDEYKTPALIPGLLPKVLERLATILSEVRGSDSAGLAMGGLLACGAAIPDCYKIQPKPRSDPGWMLAPRIWVTMVGGVASIKTSTVESITEPFALINSEMYEAYARAMARYNAMEPADKKQAEEPECRRILISDSTSQGAQDIMRYNEDGLLNVQDELGHFYGSLDQFSRGGNSGAERYFWARTFEGGSYSVDRANKQRKFMIKNCGMSLFGGIQPDVIRRYGDDSANDGLLQRSLFIMLKKAVLDRDIAAPPVQEEYNELIRELHQLPRDRSAVINFTPEASEIRNSFFEETLKLSDAYGGWNGKLGEHISKWRGMFCRICLIIHITENIKDPLGSNIDVGVAERVRDLFLSYLLPHSEAFYLGVLSSAGETAKLEAVAKYILAHNCTEISGRDLLNMVRATRNLTSKDVDLVFQQMFYLSWIMPKEKKRSDSTRWDVNPLVHQLYRVQAEETRQQNEARRAAIMARKGYTPQSAMSGER